MFVGVVLCGLGALGIFDAWNHRDIRPSAHLTEVMIMTGVCLTLGPGMIGLGLYDGFLSPTHSLGTQHNRFIKAAIRLAIGTLGGFVVFAVGTVGFQILREMI